MTGEDQPGLQERTSFCQGKTRGIEETAFGRNMSELLSRNCAKIPWNESKVYLSQQLLLIHSADIDVGIVQRNATIGRRDVLFQIGGGRRAFA
jgi:hypothetical protein